MKFLEETYEHQYIITPVLFKIGSTIDKESNYIFNIEDDLNTARENAHTIYAHEKVYIFLVVDDVAIQLVETYEFGELLPSVDGDYILNLLSTLDRGDEILQWLSNYMDSVEFSYISEIGELNRQISILEDEVSHEV